MARFPKLLLGLSSGVLAQPVASTLSNLYTAIVMPIGGLIIKISYLKISYSTLVETKKALSVWGFAHHRLVGVWFFAHFCE
ncbi:hypothetical protein CEK60_00100 [Halomonas sp. N3-2A]|nr:hypothetical protein CEK60_00100 [Halomonas sp. N3-2A]